MASEDIWRYLSPTIGALAVLANMVQIALIKRRKKSVPASLIFILNLSISDLFVGICIIVTKTMYFMALENKDLFRNNHYTMAMDLLIYVFFRMSLFISIFNVVAITIDRLVIVVSPLKYRSVDRRRILIVVAILMWIVALTIAFFSWYYRKSKQKIYREELVFPVLILPTVILLSNCYLFIWRATKKQNRKFKTLQSPTTTRKPRGVSVDSASSISSPQQQNQLLIRNRQQKRLIVLAFTVVMAFTVCWVPLSIYSLLKALGHTVKRRELENIFFIIAISNSLLDPLIYINFDRRKLFQRIKRTLTRSRSAQQTAVV
ncbi:octopamine receptor beta-1R-like [Clytia hemisphaerica]